MTTQTTQLVFVFMMLSLAIIGFYCAARLNSTYPLWLRLIVLYPALAALCTLGAMLKGHYVAYVQDIVLAFGTDLIYIVLASRFSDRPWLDIRTHTKAT